MKTITLANPLPYGKERSLDKLILREPKAGDLRGLKLNGLQDMDVDLTLKIAARLSVDAIGAEHLNELDPSDLLKVMEGVVGFFGSSEETSPTTPDAPGP